MISLPNDERFYWESKNMFKTKLDNIRTFIMKNYSIGMHMQEFFEINIVTRGKGEHFIEKSRLQANVGDVFIIPPMVKHGYMGGDGFDVFHILISDKFIKKNITELQMIPSFFVLFTAEPLMRATAKAPLHLKLSDDQFERVYKTLCDSLDYHVSYDPSDALIRSGYGLAIITILCKIYTVNVQKENHIASDSDESFMQAISAVHERYYEKLTVDELARIAKLSRSTFIKKFKKICGLPPMEYIIQQRIEAAEQMLVNTNFSILDISFKCGFYDAAHFSKRFVKKNGIYPSEYRKKFIEHK